MPGRVWSERQLQSLQRQLEKGKWVPDIRVYGKEAGGIRGKAYELGFSYGKKWTPEEELILRRQINTGREVDQILIVDRNFNGIKNKAYRLGLKKPQRQTRRWNEKEKLSLRFHVQSLHFTARRVLTKQIFFARTLDSIAQQIRRMGLSKRSFVEGENVPYTELFGKSLKFRLEKNCLFLSSGDTTFLSGGAYNVCDHGLPQMLFSKGVQIGNGKWDVKSITYLLYVDFVRKRRLTYIFPGFSRRQNAPAEKESFSSFLLGVCWFFGGRCRGVGGFVLWVILV